jgi:hypothetical protein
MDSASAVKQSLPLPALMARTVTGPGVTEVIGEANRIFPGGLRMHCVLLALVGAMAGFGQENSGRIAGTITDQTGTAVPDARVVATSPTLPRAVETLSDKLRRGLLAVLPRAISPEPRFSQIVRTRIPRSIPGVETNCRVADKHPPGSYPQHRLRRRQELPEEAFQPI